MLFIQVFERLQKLNICMSYRTTIRLVNALGMDYDAVVCKWRDSLVPGLENLTSVSFLVCYSIEIHRSFRLMN